jgi:hypothetical protein
MRKDNMNAFFNIPTSKETEVGGIQHKRKAVFILLAFMLVVAHFIFLTVHFEPAISTPDANSYFAQAKLIAKEGKTYFEPESILQYVGPHWRRTGDNRYYCIHAPGFPVILAVAYRILGPKAALWVNPLMASFSLLGLFLLCRLWVGEGWGLLAAALMAVNPFANEHALFGDSHTATIFFMMWALFFLAQWTKTHLPWRAFGAGLFIGIIPTIRYPELMYLPAIGIFVLFHFQNDKAFRRSLMAGVIGFAIPIGALCIRNQTAYGAFWRTGYTIAYEQTSLFGWDYFMSFSLQYLQRLMSEGCGLVFGLGLTGIAVLCARRSTRKEGALFAMLVVPITLVYMSFFSKPDPQSMRYLLPTFYIYTIAGVWFLRLLANNHYCSACSGSVVLLLITIWWGLPQSHRLIQHLKKQNAVLAQVTSILEKRVEPGSILIANEGINQHLDFIGYWRLVDASILNFPGSKPPQILAPNQAISLKREHRNIEARLKYVNLTGEELFDTFAQDVWQWAEKNRKVYWIANEEQINNHKRQLPGGDRLVKIEKIQIPVEDSDNINTPYGFGPPMGLIEDFIVPQGRIRGAMPPFQGPQGPNRIFDLLLNGEPLFLVEWMRESQ